MAKKEDLTGYRFADLIVLEKGKTERNKYGTKQYWLCKTDDGEILEIRTDNLKNRKCTEWKKDFSGEKYGSLTLLKKIKGETHTLYLCECECGNKITTEFSSIKRGATSSCGCKKKQVSSKTGLENIKKAKEGLKKFQVENTNLKNLNNIPLSNNTSGAKGVYLHKPSGTWMARINFKRKPIHLGNFKEKEDAIKARKKAEEIYFHPIIEKYKD